jgi:hypothetical protein
LYYPALLDPPSSTDVAGKPFRRGSLWSAHMIFEQNPGIMREEKDLHKSSERFLNRKPN